MTLARNLVAVAFAGLLSGAASAQQAQPPGAEPSRRGLSGSDLPSLPPGPGDGMGAYIVAGFRGADDWQFIMGPRESPRMAMRLVRQTPEGGAAFHCQREDGAMTMGLTLSGLRVPMGHAADITIGVGENSHPLPMTVRTEPPEGEDSVFEASGQAVADILAAMGQAPQDRWTELTIQASPDRRARIAVPDPRAIARAAATVCDGWSRLAAMPRVPGAAGEALVLPGRAAAP